MNVLAAYLYEYDPLNVVHGNPAISGREAVLKA
jgi:hypothetical protein